MNLIQISNVSIRQHNGLYSLNDLHRASGGEDKNARAVGFKTNKLLI